MQLEGLNKGLSCVSATLDAEDHHGATFTPDVFLIFLILRTVFQAGISDPFHGFVVLQMLRNREGVFTVALHAEWQSFDALQEDPGIIR